MLSAENITITIAVSIITTLLAFLTRTVWGLSKEVVKMEDRIVARIGERMDKEKEESILSHRRHQVTDRIVSKITEHDYDSRQVATNGSIPNLHPKLRKMVNDD